MLNVFALSGQFNFVFDLHISDIHELEIDFVEFSLYFLFDFVLHMINLCVLVFEALINATQVVLSNR